MLLWIAAALTVYTGGIYFPATALRAYPAPGPSEGPSLGKKSDGQQPFGWSSPCSARPARPRDAPTSVSASFFGGRLAGRVAFAGGRIAAGDGGRGRAVIGRMGRVRRAGPGPAGKGLCRQGRGRAGWGEDRLGEVVLHGVRDIMARCRRTAEWPCGVANLPLQEPHPARRPRRSKAGQRAGSGARLCR